MIGLLATSALAQDEANPWAEVITAPPPAAIVEVSGPEAQPEAEAAERRLPLETYRIEPVGPGAGLQLAAGQVVGGDGATTAFTARTRVTFADAGLAVSLPFATWQTEGDRAAGLGNLAATLLVRQRDHVWVGAAVQVPLGETWTWVNEAEELWSSGGVDLIAIAERPGTVTLLARGSAGLHFSPGYEPVPATWFKVSGTGALDVAARDDLGVTAEASLAWWDVSPFDVAGLVRYDPTDELRLRAGLVLPLASWAGWQAAPVPAGLREATLRLDVTAGL